MIAQARPARLARARAARDAVDNPRPKRGACGRHPPRPASHRLEARGQPNRTVARQAERPVPPERADGPHQPGLRRATGDRHRRYDPRRPKPARVVQAVRPNDRRPQAPWASPSASSRTDTGRLEGPKAPIRPAKTRSRDDRTADTFRTAGAPSGGAERCRLATNARASPHALPPMPPCLGCGRGRPHP